MSSETPTINERGKTRVDAEICITSVRCDETMVWMVLADGRVIGAPLTWFPRLHNATPAQRDQWRIVGPGHGVHWEELDEDISARVLMGHPS